MPFSDNIYKKTDRNHKNILKIAKKCDIIYKIGSVNIHEANK